jgi:GNAT superfamily N-acetyltransferase
VTDRSPHRPRPELVVRRPTPADHPRLVADLDDWWGGRRTRDQLPRFWFEHFAGTSWLAATPDGTVAGFLVGFRSPDRPALAVVHLVGTSPNLRRRGIGRLLEDRFAEQMAATGSHRIEATTWPGDPISLAFHRALGFTIDDGPGTVRRHGVPAYPDHDHPGEDRTRLFRDL